MALWVPNRERMAYLTHLARHLPGLSVSYGYQAHEVVMHVMAVDSDTGQDVAAVSVGCRYEAGQWWFVRTGDGTCFAAANELDGAARMVRAAIGDKLRQVVA